MGRNVGTRVNLTLPSELVAVLDKLTAVTGVSRAGFIREILMEGMPQFLLLVQALDQAKAKNLDAYKTMVKAVDQARTMVDQTSLELRTAGRSARRRLVRVKKKKT